MFSPSQTDSNEIFKTNANGKRCLFYYIYGANISSINLEERLFSKGRESLATVIYQMVNTGCFIPIVP